FSRQREQNPLAQGTVDNLRLTDPDVVQHGNLAILIVRTVHGILPPNRLVIDQETGAARYGPRIAGWLALTLPPWYALEAPAPFLWRIEVRSCPVSSAMQYRYPFLPNRASLGEVRQLRSGAL